MVYTYHSPGVCNVATLGQSEIFKMASKMAAAKRNLLFYSSSWQPHRYNCNKMSFSTLLDMTVSSAILLSMYNSNFRLNGCYGNGLPWRRSCGRVGSGWRRVKLHEWCGVGGGAAVSSVPMQNVAKPTRGRSMSMQDYDIPLRKRINSTQMTCSPVIDASPSSVDGDTAPPTAAAAAAASGGGGGGTEQLVANWLEQPPWRHRRQWRHVVVVMGWKCQLRWRATRINQSRRLL